MSTHSRRTCPRATPGRSSRPPNWQDAHLAMYHQCVMRKPPFPAPQAQTACSWDRPPPSLLQWKRGSRQDSLKRMSRARLRTRDRSFRSRPVWRRGDPGGARHFGFRHRACTADPLRAWSPTRTRTTERSPVSSCAPSPATSRTAHHLPRCSPRGRALARCSAPRDFPRIGLRRSILRPSSSIAFLQDAAAHPDLAVLFSPAPASAPATHPLGPTGKAAQPGAAAALVGGRCRGAVCCCGLWRV